MAEFALLTGLNYLEKNEKQNSKILLDDYKYSNYHSNNVSKTNQNIKNIYEQRKNDTMDPKKFMIPVYYNLQTESQDTGSGTNTYNGPSVEKFENQFEPARFNSKSVVPLNDIDINDKQASGTQNKIALKNDWSIFTDNNYGSESNSGGGSDMTYGIIAKDDKSFMHNNMNAFNRMRDYETPELRDSRKLEYFSGSSKTYTPKQETEPFFQPIQGMTFGQGGMPVVSEFIANRMNEGVRREKKKEKPFEPRRIGPGIGLPLNQDSLNGIHDTTRILPKNIDELRRADNAKLSYNAPVIPGKKGEKRSVVAAFEHRRPDKFRQDVKPVQTGGQLKAIRTPDNINIDIGNRTFSTPLIGPAAGKYGVNTPEMQGKVQESKAHQLSSFSTGPAGSITQNLHNSQAFSVHDTQRTFTNIELNGNLGKSNGGTVYDPNNVANPTQQLNSFQPTSTSRSQGNIAYDPNQQTNPTQQLNSFQPTNTSRSQGAFAYDHNQIANPTQQLQHFQPTNTSRSQGAFAYDPSIMTNPTQQLNSFQPTNTARSQGAFTYDSTQQTNPTQQLNSFQPTNTSRSQGAFAYDPNIITNPTQQLNSFQPTNTSRSQGAFAYDPNIITNPTQQLKSFQPTNTSRSQGVFTFDSNQIANPTQQLKSFQSTGSGRAQGAFTYDSSQVANPTQQLNFFQQSNSGRAQGSTIYDPNQIINSTLRQTTNMPFNTFINCQENAHISYLEDDVRQTQKQSLVLETNMGYIGTHGDQGYIVTDASAPTTLKQTMNYNNYSGAIGNKTINNANSAIATNWEAPITMKQTINYNNHGGGIRNNNEIITPIQNAHTNISKEVVSKSRDPTSSNVNMIPDINSIGQIILKDHVNIDRFNPPSQIINNLARPEINQINKLNPFYDDNINKYKYNTMASNDYFNNGIASLNNLQNLIANL